MELRARRSPGMARRGQGFRYRSRDLGVLAAALLLCGCGASAHANVPGAVQTRAVAASCAALSSRAAFARARVVLEGTMLSGPTAGSTPPGVLSSPARVRVTRYLKGHGPSLVRVKTAMTRTSSGVVVDAEGIEPVAGQRWRIYAVRSAEPFATSVCDGSHRLSGERQAAREFSSNGLRFAYPGAWHVLRPEIASTFENTLVALSPQPLHQPCARHQSRSVTTVVCHQPLTRLQPGSVLLSLDADAMPGFRFSRQPGTAVQVGGRSARLTASRSDCQIAADLRERVAIAVPGRVDAWDQLTACIRGPDITRSQSQVQGVLRSIRFLG